MKRRLSLLYILLFLSFGAVKGQALLRVSALVNWPDTVYNNQVLPVGAIVENLGTAPYQGPLQIVIQTDSNTFSYLYFNISAPVLILPGDTVGFYPPNGYLFDSTVFRPGNNVVVVWPYSAQSVGIDTITTNIFFVPTSIQSLYEPQPIAGLSIYPNPASSFATISSPETGLEGVRILNPLGQEIIALTANGANFMVLPLTDLPVGLYILEVIGMGGQRSGYRLLKNE